MFVGPAGASTPIQLLLPQSTAFSILGASCGGIPEKAYAGTVDVTVSSAGGASATSPDDEFTYA